MRTRRGFTPGSFNSTPPPPSLSSRSLGYWVCCYPLDIIKSAIQTDSIYPGARKYAGWGDAARQLWREGGVKRFTAGIAPCLLRSFPANAAAFVVRRGSSARARARGQGSTQLCRRAGSPSPTRPPPPSSHSPQAYEGAKSVCEKNLGMA